VAWSVELGEDVTEDPFQAALGTPRAQMPCGKGEEEAGQSRQTPAGDKWGCKKK
jgi:hypothetical protein